jgi:hypothetical protein
MMDELLATPPLSSCARGFPPRRRLEPLPEEEDTDSPTPTPAPAIEEETPPEQVSYSSRDVTLLLHSLRLQQVQLRMPKAISNNRWQCTAVQYKYMYFPVRFFAVLRTSLSVTSIYCKQNVVVVLYYTILAVHEIFTKSQSFERK